MGAGKGHTLRALLRDHTVRLPSNTVWCAHRAPLFLAQPSVTPDRQLPPLRIDPDALSRHLPERPQYLHADAAAASALLHPEASLLQEIIAAVARKQRRSLVVDGSLTDREWFEGFMRSVGTSVRAAGGRGPGVLRLAFVLGQDVPPSWL